MSCPDVSELMLWLDGELPIERAGDIGKHLASCPECRSLVEAQRRMETLWREDWRDPEAAAFQKMRMALTAQAPWWRRQRTWFAVAALFSVYLGVKIFYLDDRGASLADIALESHEAPAEEITEEEFLRDTQEVFVTPETRQEEQAEITEEIITDEQEELLEQEHQNRPASEYEYTEAATAEILLEACEDVATPAEGSDVLSGVGSSQDESAGYHSAGLGGVAEEEGPRDLYEYEEDGTVFAYTSGDDSPSEDSETVMYGGSGGGGTSGGTGLVSSVSRSVDSCEETSASGDTDFGDSITWCEAAAPTFYSEPVASVELSTGENLILRFDDWEELFQLSNSIFTGDTLHLQVDSLGVVTGSGVPPGTVLSLPDNRYGDCRITIFSD